jgi:hypothetical protein
VPKLRKLRFAVRASLVVLLAAASSPAVQTLGTDDNHIKIGGLLQAWAVSQEDGAPNHGTETDFYVRRIRLMLFGKVSQRVSFFIDTDSPNLGKGGDWSGRMFIQDAYVEYEAHEALQIAGGMLLLPFSHHGMQGATTLLGVDYHAALLRYPHASNLVWRDAGLMVRGMPFGSVLEYRVGLFNGIRGNTKPESKTATTEDGTDLAWREPTDPRNPSDAPRVTARLTLNLFDPEGGPGVAGMFYDGIYLEPRPEGLVSPKTVVAFGGSVDWQKDANVTWDAIPATGVRGVAERSDYLAAAGDVFWDIPVGPEKIMSVNGQINFFAFDHGARGLGSVSYYDGVPAASRLYSGWGVAAEAGFRYDIVQPIVRYDRFTASDTEGDLGAYQAVAGGINAWLSGHTASLKMQIGAETEHGGKWLANGTLQAQLMF